MRAQVPRDRRDALTPRRAVAITCGAKQCDVEAIYHADCLTSIYEKLGPKSSGAAKNRALAHSIENLRFSGASDVPMQPCSVWLPRARGRVLQAS